MKSRVFVTLVTFILATAFNAVAQDTDRIDAQLTNTPAPTYVIRNARIVTVSGADIENGTIVISGGRIAAGGAEGFAPPGAPEIEPRGLSAFSGMSDPGTE